MQHTNVNNKLLSMVHHLQSYQIQEENELALGRMFWIATEQEIKDAETTDVYFLYTKKILEKYGLHKKVVIEVYVRNLPFEGNWGVLLGVHEVAKLLEGLPIKVKSMNEGEIFQVNPKSVVYEPVMQIECYYDDFCLYENPLLGLLSNNTGIASKAARYRILAPDKTMFSFGSRRIHPVLAPASERAAYIAGFDGISNILAGKLLDVTPVGTMPHAMIQVFGDQRKAWLAFDETMPKNVPRIALIVLESTPPFPINALTPHFLMSEGSSAFIRELVVGPAETTVHRFPFRLTSGPQ